MEHKFKIDDRVEGISGLVGTIWGLGVGNLSRVYDVKFDNGTFTVGYLEHELEFFKWNDFQDKN